MLYSSGEESEHQIKARGERLGIEDAPLYILAETCLERILEEIARLKPSFLIVDSIQTVFSLKFQSAPGSIGQVREAATQLLFAAKGQNIPTFLVGHVTKDGNLAGPKALEHIVDTVLYFEGEKHHSHRVVRAVKNRFGAVSELGVFEMTGTGLRAVPNPSQLFLSERPANAPGSAVLCCMEGSRPLLVEVQALVSTTSYGNARRMASGVDQNRLSLLLAVLEKRAGLNLARRRRLRERRRGHDGRRACRRPRGHRRGGVERAQPSGQAGHSGLRRSGSGGGNPRRVAGAAARPGGRADGFREVYPSPRQLPADRCSAGDRVGRSERPSGKRSMLSWIGDSAMLKLGAECG